MNTITSPVEKEFILGDQWIYFKIYTGYKTADLVLVNHIAPLANELLKEGIIDKWFFIRYSDPDFHLRLRFRLTNVEAFLGKVILKINHSLKELANNKLVSCLQTDTYKREVRRYGLNSIDIAESLFYFDSEMIAKGLSMITNDEDEQTRWLFALLSADALMTDFGFSENDKLLFAERSQEAFGREFGMNKYLKIQIDKKFRLERKNICNILENKENLQDSEYLEFYKLVVERSVKNKSIVEHLQLIAKENLLKNHINDLLGSYLHMMFNRLFISEPRLNEMMSYMMLYRFYKTEIAKKKAKQKAKASKNLEEITA